MSLRGARIDARAAVHPEAVLGADVEVGPFAVIGAGVVLGRGTRVSAHAVVEGPAVVGEENLLSPFCVVGGAPQHKRERGRAGDLVLGDRNEIREHVTIHRGTDGRTTRVGDDNLFMVGAHAAHDTQVGSHVVVANQVQLAGHVEVADHVTFGGLAGVAQFVRVGEGAFVAAGAMCERDVPPFVIVQGDRARVRGLNVVGLRRRGLDEGTIVHLRRAYRALFGGRPRAEALAGLGAEDLRDARVQLLLRACSAPSR